VYLIAETWAGGQAFMNEPEVPEFMLLASTDPHPRVAFLPCSAPRTETRATFLPASPCKYWRSPPQTPARSTLASARCGNATRRPHLDRYQLGTKPVETGRPLHASPRPLPRLHTFPSHRVNSASPWALADEFRPPSGHQASGQIDRSRRSFRSIRP